MSWDFECRDEALTFSEGAFSKDKSKHWSLSNFFQLQYNAQDQKTLKNSVYVIKILIKAEECKKSCLYRRSHNRCSVKKVFLKLLQNS